RDLARAGLDPRLLERRMMQERNRLAPFARVLPQLDPRLPLARGYALVKSVDGAALTSRAKAARYAALRLEFADGELAVTVEEGAGVPSLAPSPAGSEPAPAPRRAARPKADEPRRSKADEPQRSKAEEPRQGDLF
ncbi:exodeoxyribonuclease VII large subunit, partial [Novosphingobium sp. 1949]|nr:exodeoxyribonuclease VII large subunit [Novosphingobium organovorum]